MRQNKHAATILAMHAFGMYVSRCMQKKFEINIIGPSPNEQRPAKTGSNPNESLVLTREYICARTIDF